MYSISMRSVHKKHFNCEDFLDSLIIIHFIHWLWVALYTCYITFPQHLAVYLFFSSTSFWSLYLACIRIPFHFHILNKKVWEGRVPDFTGLSCCIVQTVFWLVCISAWCKVPPVPFCGFTEGAFFSFHWFPFYPVHFCFMIQNVHFQNLLSILMYFSLTHITQ